MISNREYQARRRELMATMEPNSIAVIAAAPERVRSKDTLYPYKQSNNLSYLCGFPEPQAVIVLIPQRPQGEFVLFCRDRDPLREIWDGYRQGPTGAVANFGADDAFPIDDIDDILPSLLEGKNRVYYSIGSDPVFDQQMLAWVKEVAAREKNDHLSADEFIDLDHLLSEMRLIKSAAEIKLISRAGEISAAAHCRAMRHCSPGRSEFHLQAEIEHEFMSSGATGPAYTSIVGGGKNACILHYIDNRDKLKTGDLVLIDAGCEYQNYAADITRTFPVNGKFTAPQAAIYDLVLAAQRAAMENIAPGLPYDLANRAVVQVITQGLLELGLLQGDWEALIDAGAYKAFYMHSVSHWLGMDVHDVGDYKIDDQWRVYEPGMVLTVEPGIYIAPDNQNVATKWRGIGVRIEDNVVVTKRGHKVLTDAVPREREQIEQLMAGEF
ncbi:MAG: Xaa-Pro aminopeptidase [Porticoccaceae bacterium]